MNKPEAATATCADRDGRFWRQPAPAPLRPWVQAFLARKAHAPRERVTIFPNAQPELFFHFGSGHFASTHCGAPLAPLAPACLLAPRLRSYEHGYGPQVDWFLIQLTPRGCRQLLGTPMAALLGNDRALAELCGAAALTLHRQLRRAADFPARCRAATSWLLGRVGIGTQGDAGVSVLATLARSTPLPRANLLARSLGVGERRLRQRFAAEIGVGPKQWLSLMRAERLWTGLHPAAGSAVDAALEFADDSHAHREFVRYTGLSPGAYRAAKAAGDGLVNGGCRRAWPER